MMLLENIISRFNSINFKIDSYKLYLNLKNSFNDMCSEFMIFRFHTTNNLKSLYSDILFKADTQFKPILHNLGNIISYQMLIKTKSDKIFIKALNLFSDERLGEIINKASDINLKRIVDNIPCKNLPKIFRLLSEQKVEQIINLHIGKEFLKDLKNQTKKEYLNKDESIYAFEIYINKASTID